LFRKRDVHGFVDEPYLTQSIWYVYRIR